MPPSIRFSSLQSSFSRDVLTLVTGTIIAQIITLLASPIITRIYDPEAFGLLALFSSITCILVVISCLRYELAIILPSSDKEAANVFGLCIIIVIFITIISIPVLMAIQDPFIQLFKIPQIGPFLWLIPIVEFVSGMYLALNYWTTRMKSFHRLSIARLANTCSTTGTQLGFGYLGYTTGGTLIGASVIGQSVSTCVLGVKILKEHLFFFRLNITFKGILDVLKRYSNFPKYDIWSALLNTISWQIPFFILSFYFSTVIVGYYSLGMIMIQMPMNLIGGAIAQVFYQRAVEVNMEKKIGMLVDNIFKFLVKIGLFPMFTLLFIGKDLFSVLFGTQWEIAGIYAQILSIWAFIWFISSPLSTLISVLEVQSWGLNLNIWIFSTRVASLVAGGIIGNVFIALALFSLSGIMVYGYLCIKIMIYSKIPFANIKNEIYNNIPKILIIGAFYLILKLLTIDSRIVVTISICAGITYYLLIIKEDPIIRHFINQIIIKREI